MIRGGGPWVNALQAFAGSIIATLAVFWAAVTTLDISGEFPPLASPGPTIFFTAVSALGAIGVFAVLRRRADRPERLFRRIAGAVLLVSFLPDLWLLSDGAAGAFPAATPRAIAVLMVMHIVAAAIIVWFMTGSGRPEPDRSNPQL
jgi:hypothetical protein